MWEADNTFNHHNRRDRATVLSNTHHPNPGAKTNVTAWPFGIVCDTESTTIVNFSWDSGTTNLVCVMITKPCRHVLWYDRQWRTSHQRKSTFPNLHTHWPRQWYFFWYYRIMSSSDLYLATVRSANRSLDHYQMKNFELCTAVWPLEMTANSKSM